MYDGGLDVLIDDAAARGVMRRRHAIASAAPKRAEVQVMFVLSWRKKQNSRGIPYEGMDNFAIVVSWNPVIARSYVTGIRSVLRVIRVPVSLYF